VLPSRAELFVLTADLILIVLLLLLCVCAAGVIFSSQEASCCPAVQSCSCLVWRTERL